MKTIAIEHPSDYTRNALRIEWNIGKRCNFNCSYCDEYTHDNFSKHLTFEVAAKAVDRIISVAGSREVRISLTGGEPMVNPHIEQIIEYMHHKGIKIGVTTNGSRTVEFYKKVIPYLSTFLISYHFEYHGKDVLPDKIVECFSFAKNQPHHVHTHVHLMMLPTMFDEAKKAIELFKNEGIQVIIRRIRPAYVKDNPTELAMPFYDGITTLKLGVAGPDYSGDFNYYSTDELEFLKEYNA